MERPKCLTYLEASSYLERDDSLGGMIMTLDTHYGLV